MFKLDWPPPFPFWCTQMPLLLSIPIPPFSFFRGSAAQRIPSFVFFLYLVCAGLECLILLRLRFCDKSVVVFSLFSILREVQRPAFFFLGAGILNIVDKKVSWSVKHKHNRMKISYTCRVNHNHVTCYCCWRLVSARLSRCLSWLHLFSLLPNLILCEWRFTLRCYYVIQNLSVVFGAQRLNGG